MKKIIAIICTSLIVLSATISIFAAPIMSNPMSQAAVDFAVQRVTEQYEEYYTISDVNVNVLKTTVTGDNVESYAEINFGRMLKAQTANELPYVTGVIAAIDSLNECTGLASRYAENLIQELEKEYIGKVQSTSVYVYISSPRKMNMAISLEEQVTVLVENINGERLAVEILQPSSDEYMYQRGEQAVQRIISSDAINSVQPLSDPINHNIKNYNRITARDYAREWSCELALTDDHETCHNPNYDFYYGSRGGDCANFVSQCIHEGGLSTDTTWFKDSSAWIGVSPLCNYMVNNKLFFKCTDEMKAFAGSIIRWSVGSHVGLVDQNDTCTMTFCAHNVCRKSSPWMGEDVYFYLPYWDSYANAWTTK